MFKARMKFAKEGVAKYISHLDLMRAMQRAMARCEMPLWFTEGFHQHAYVSVVLPLSTGFSSECEFLDFNLTCDAMPENALEALNAAFPTGLRALEVYPFSDGGRKPGEIAWSQYRIDWRFPDGIPTDFPEKARRLFAQPVVEILKRSKRGESMINMREFMRDFSITSIGENAVTASVVTAAGNRTMSPVYLTKAIEKYLELTPSGDYHRSGVWTADNTPFR